MKVIIMRHGDARFLGAERVLSKQGEQEANMTGLKLVSSYNITRIFASPKQRALQTASIVQSLLKGSKRPQVEVLNELSPYGRPTMVQDFVEATSEPNDTILLVSHIPQVVNLTYTLCGREFDLPVFQTASALILETEGDKYIPTAFYTPYGETYLDKVKVGAIPVSSATVTVPMVLSAGTLGTPLHTTGQVVA